jgi:hypothetical protein
LHEKGRGLAIHNSQGTIRKAQKVGVQTSYWKGGIIKRGMYASELPEIITILGMRYSLE